MVRTTFVRQSIAAACLLGCSLPVGLKADQPHSTLHEPVYRVANKVEGPQAERHPLDPALEFARSSLAHIRENVHDYTCTLVKRERINGRLQDHEYIFAKIRSRKVENGRTTVPFSVYLHFLKPNNVKGREVLYVEGRNNNQLCASEGGFQGRFLPTVWLRPDSMLAMRGQLYPITEIGIENLVVKLIERGEQSRQYDEVEVEFRKGAKINGRPCTLLQVKHPVRRPQYDFYLAQIFIDDELNLPIRYVAYDWPAQPGGQPEVLEEYTYLNLKLNVGLTDADFDPKNPNYNF